ncbi:hypothetical protein [Priestia megaterium]
MATRMKVIIFRVILVFVGVLFVAGYFHQRQQDQQQSSSKKEPQQEQKVKYGDTFIPFQKEEKKEELEKNSAAVSPNEGKKLADFYSSEDIATSKQVAQEFVKNLYPFDGKDLNKSINKALPFATENLQKMMKTEENTMRPTQDFFFRELKETTAVEPDEATPDALTWVVTAKGDIKNQKGQVTDHNVTTYLLQITKEKDSFKVAEYSEENSK